MNNRIFLLLVLILFFLGIAYRLILTANGNFIFNMDNARDMIDVREIVVLGKLRLIGPTSGIEGFYNGPAWYLLLAIPFILSGGDPYAEIILMLFFWIIGGIFLLKILFPFGKISTISGIMIWISSNYIALANLYAFNPNPVLLLTPVFIYFLDQYLKKHSLFNSFIIWFLSGLFFNLEMNAGIFFPVIILMTIILNKKVDLIKKKDFIFGILIFATFLLPQIFFELRHHLFMTKSIINYLDKGITNYIFIDHLVKIIQVYKQVLLGLFLNNGIFLSLVLSIYLFINYKLVNKCLRYYKQILISTNLCILLPFFGHLLFPVNVMPWHLGEVAAAAVIFFSISLGILWKENGVYKIFTILIFLYIIWVCSNELLFSINKKIIEGGNNMDPAIFNNEIKAIDYVYQQAQNKSFKVYVYLPSVIDYPYQYLFWWWGLKKYGYLPLEYAYSPNKPPYISNKEKFNVMNNKLDSSLIFLIKQPDQRGERHLWENDFNDFPFIESKQVGPLIIETRHEISDNSK